MYHETFIETSPEVKIYLKYSPLPKKESSTLLFLHGYPDTHKTWQTLMETLKTEFQVAAIDLRGAGKSSRPKKRTDYNVKEIFKDITNVIYFLKETNHSKEDSKTHLVGHDWGSLIGWCYASDSFYSKNIASFTGIAGPHPALARKQMLQYAKKGIWSWDIDEMARFFRQGTMSWYILFFQIPILPELAWTTGSMFFWKNMLEAGGVPKDDPMWNYEPKEILESAIGPIQLYRELLQGEKIPTPEKIEIPCQAIVPVNDFAITPDLYENLSEHASYFRKNFLDANHWVHREKPEEVAKLIRDFVKNLV